MFQLELHSKAEMQAASRSRLYGLLLEAFQYPTSELYERAKAGKFAHEMAAQLKDLPYDLAVPGKWGQTVPASLADLESEYMRLFDLGGPSAPPTFLYEGQYSGGVTTAMEEVLAFYHYFGLRRPAESRERPDHIAVEFQFMHYLTFLEAKNASQDEAKLSFVKGQRDFLKLHLLDFVSAVANEHSQAQSSFYSDVVLFAKDFCQREMAYLTGLLGDTHS